MNQVYKHPWNIFGARETDNAVNMLANLEKAFVKRLCMGAPVEPLNKGHFGANSFVPCREVVPISEVK